MSHSNSGKHMDPAGFLRRFGRGITARSMMTPHPITVSPKNTVQDVMKIFYENDIRHVPVVEDGKLIGILSERDIRNFTLPVSEVVIEPELSKELLLTPIQAIYKSDFVPLGPEAELDEILEVLVEERVGAIPIVQSRDFQLIGIISYIDVLKQIQSLSELSELEARRV